MGRRAFIVVLDACGAGPVPDSAAYGDEGANTLVHLAELTGGLALPTFERLGLGNILPIAGVPPSRDPVVHGLLAPAGPGKDSTAGHWELAGVIAPVAPRTFPDGLPPALLARVQHVLGRTVICNRARNGLAAIEEFGAAHLASGEPILYTSVDSVVQLAAHVEVTPPAQLYAFCELLRGEIPDVGRVIARPFEGVAGAFSRTDGRRDYALAPPSRSHLQALQEAGVPVHSVGKVGELFSGVGFDACHPGASNEQAIASIEQLLEALDRGLVFANLIDTDQRYGHRKDTEGFKAALERVDTALAGWCARLRSDDLLVLTADHGCDPAIAHSDHTREQVPLLARFAGDRGRRHDGALADVGASACRWLSGASDPGIPGQPFIDA